MIKFLTKKFIIISLIVLVVISWVLVVYFVLKAKTPSLTCGERLEKLHSYALLLDKSTQLSRQEKSFDVLEADIRSLNNGVLLAEWEDVVFGGNRAEDINNYFDVIVDALKFFSK